MNKLLFWGLILFTLFSCGKPENIGKVYIYDNANLLSEEAQARLNSTDFHQNLVVIHTIDSLNYGDLNKECDNLFASYKTKMDSIEMGDQFSHYGILIVSSKNPNYSIAKLGDYYDINGGESEQYCSHDYYMQQMNKEESPQTKLLGTLEKAMRYTLNYSALTNYLRDEIYGIIIPIVQPDDSILYQYVIRPFQYPFVLALKVVKSFWLAMILVTIILYSITYGLSRWILNPTRNILKLGNDKLVNQQKINIASGCLAGLFYNIPMVVGGLSLAVYFGSCGIEFIPDLVIYANLPLESIENSYTSIYSRNSYLLAFIVVIFFYFSFCADKDLEERLRNIIKLIVSSFIFYISPVSVLWFLICYLAPSIYSGIKSFYKTDYGFMDLRLHGHSQLSAICISSLRPLFIALGSMLGVYLGTGSEEFQIGTIQEEIQVNASNTINVEDAIEYWYYNQNKE